MSVTIFIFNFLSSIVLKGGKDRRRRPVEANTLEWATSFAATRLQTSLASRSFHKRAGFEMYRTCP